MSLFLQEQFSVSSHALPSPLLPTAFTSHKAKSVVLQNVLDLGNCYLVVLLNLNPPHHLWKLSLKSWLGSSFNWGRGGREYFIGGTVSLHHIRKCGCLVV